MDKEKIKQIVNRIYRPNQIGHSELTKDIESLLDEKTSALQQRNDKLEEAQERDFKWGIVKGFRLEPEDLLLPHREVRAESLESG